MANQNDSFIDEVTEDLRRDRLFNLFRRYGWIAILLVLALVAGTIWSEYSKGQKQQQAEVWGDAVIAAAETVADDPILHDLAMLKAVMVAGASMDAAKRDGILSELSKPGAPFELLALEQKAVALIGAGRTEDAVVLIRQIQQKDGLSEPLRRRLGEMMITLGAAPEKPEGPGPQTMTVAPAN